MLLSRPGEVVTRDEIQRRLWPTGTFVDFENGLNSAVNRLRDVLGDSAEQPRFIQTIPRHGYRFLAPVERLNGYAPDRVTLEAQEQEKRQTIPRRSRIWLWAASVAVAALATGQKNLACCSIQRTIHRIYTATWKAAGLRLVSPK